MIARSTALRPTPRWAWVALAAVLLWAVAIRVWMASSGLAHGHYWDERYSVKNVRAVLATGSLEPVSYYYPSLSYLPQATLMAAVEGVSRLVGEPFSFFGGASASPGGSGGAGDVEARASASPGGSGGAGDLEANAPLRPGGYLLARLIQVALGLGTLLLTFLLGRRLISTGAGIVATVLLAVAPQHVRLSTMWKPDVTLLCATLLALWWTLDALEQPWLRRYLLAGAGVGLALAAKLNGGPIAAPLALGALVCGWRDRRHWTGAIGAGVAAVAVFVALNPQVDRYLAALDRNREIYSGRAAADIGFAGRLASVAREEVGFVLSPNFHGRWLGAAALAGMALIAIDAVRRRDRASATRALAIVVFPLAYTALYALTTPYAKENNFLQILPFTALGGAFLLDRVASGVARRMPAAVGRRGPAVAAAALALCAAAPTQAWVYRTQVPTTWDAAIDATSERLWPWEGRVAFAETPQRSLAGRARDVKGLVRAVDDLATVPADLLDRADAEMFPAARLQEGESGFHEARVARIDAASVHRFEARWFAARGPTVLALVHAPEAAGAWSVAAVPEGDGMLRVDLPPEADAPLYSMELWLRRPRRGAAAVPEVLAGGRALRLQARPAGRVVGWLTERFASDAGPIAARIPSELEHEGMLSVRVYGWR